MKDKHHKDVSQLDIYEALMKHASEIAEHVKQNPHISQHELQEYIAHVLPHVDNKSGGS